MSGEDATELRREVDAIGAVIDALEMLPGPSRERVLEYVVRALAIEISLPNAISLTTLPESREPNSSDSTAKALTFTDIRSLKEAKNPRTAMEMSAVVAYYLSELAPPEDRSDVITAADIQKYFKQAVFRLPQKIDMTLVNAAAAGYFDRVEIGKYRLNPVGYNLVVHNLPSGSNDVPSARRSKKKTTAKKASTKKTLAKKVVAKKSPVKKVAAKKAPAKREPSMSDVFRGPSVPLS
jgi:hypothetical protein